MKRKLSGIISLLLASICFFILSTNVYAGETIKTDTIQVIDVDFNKNKSIRIEADEIYETTGKYIWLKYIPAADGYLTVTASDITEDQSGATGYLALYNSTKTQAYSAKTIYYKTANTQSTFWQKFVFGLQKGQTYYLRVKAETPVKLSRVYKKVKDTSGTTYTTAPGLKKNKTKTGVLLAGSSTADWYKITLTKKQKLNIFYNAKTYGTFRISLYSATKRQLGSYNVTYTPKQQKLTMCLYNYTTGKKTSIPAGSYYIKIEKANAQSSGYYKIKWK